MKAVIVDLDRTLLRTDKTLSEYTLDIMRKCHEKGITILVATARPERAISEYQRQICFDAITTLNGARTVLPDCIIENGIAYDSAGAILTKLVAIPGMFISIETTEGIYSNVDIPEWNSNYYDGFPNLPTQGTVFKILASNQKGISHEQIESALTNDVYYSVANNELIQIMSNNATKWLGIKEMLEYLNIPQIDTMYFGDDNDDIEPIHMCGIGVAVSNAVKAVLDVADYIAGSNDEDGVAHFIETNIL